MIYIALLMSMLAMLISVFTAVALRNHMFQEAREVSRYAAEVRTTAYNEDEARIRAENIMADRRKELKALGVIVLRDYQWKKNC